MTYAEASDRLGIKIASVKRQARARSWPRRTMNDGTVQVGIPADRLADDPPPSPPLESGADERAELSARLAVAEARAEAAEKRAIELAEDRDAWRLQAQKLASEPRPGAPAVRMGLIDRLFGRR